MKEEAEESGHSAQISELDPGGPGGRAGAGEPRSQWQLTSVMRKSGWLGSHRHQPLQTAVPDGDSPM